MEENIKLWYLCNHKNQVRSAIKRCLKKGHYNLILNKY